MSEKQPKKKKTAGDIVLTVVLIAAICVFCYAGYNLFHIYTEYKKGTDEYNEIAQMAVTERDPDGEEAGPSAGELKAPMNIDLCGGSAGYQLSDRAWQGQRNLPSQNL